MLIHVRAGTETALVAIHHGDCSLSLINVSENNTMGFGYDTTFVSQGCTKRVGPDTGIGSEIMECQPAFHISIERLFDQDAREK